ncbi:HutD family protein [Streptomyces sp. NPDC050095]|uniref:HutD/Ves family protein n=1 Tax=unclassified Streptomyces TaxID=2593676 RepID=UPI0034484A86
MIETVVRLLPAASRDAVAWKNGGGVTREIACAPDGAGMDDFLWRASLAEVAADGPFSAFPGVDRTLTMVEGDGMELTVDGVATLVESPGEPRDFAGDVATHCRLLGGRTVVNFNVMWRRDALAAPPSVAVVRGRLPLAAHTSEVLVVALAAEGAELTAPDFGRSLGRYDAAVVRGGADLHAKGPVAVVTLDSRAAA